jgi:hypothetical protein
VNIQRRLPIEDEHTPQELARMSEFQAFGNAGAQKI